METDSSGQYRDNLRVRRHSGCKENDGYEHEHRAVHIDEVRNEIQIVIEDDGLQGCFLFNEIVYLLVYVKDYHQKNDKQQGHHEGRDELLEYVPVYFLRFECHRN